MMAETMFAQVAVPNWPNTTQYATRAEYSAAVYALADTVDKTADPILFHTVRMLVILDTLLVVEGVAASGSDPSITTGWLESVFNSTSSTLYSRLVDSQTTLLQAAVDSWGELRNLSGTFEHFAGSFDSAGYTYGAGALASDKTKFFKGIVDEHYIVAAKLCQDDTSAWRSS
jgi:hypothetical protein